MSEIVQRQAGIAAEGARQTEPKRVAEKRRGLVLDDVLGVIRKERQTYGLPEARFGLEQIEREAGAKSAAERIITDTISRHAPEIYSNPDPIFDKICNIRRGRRLDRPGIYSGWRIPPVHAAAVLRALLGIALQTIVQLPKKDPAMKDGTRELKLLALHCDKLAQEFADVFARREIYNRAWTYFRGHDD